MMNDYDDTPLEAGMLIHDGGHIYGIILGEASDTEIDHWFRTPYDAGDQKIWLTYWFIANPRMGSGHISTFRKDHTNINPHYIVVSCRKNFLARHKV
jgi:hypothetical protein